MQYDGLVAAQAGAFVDRARHTPSIIQIAFGADDKERGLLREGIQPRKVDVPAVHDVEGARFQNQFVEQADIVRLPLCNANKTGDIAAEIHQRVELDGGFALTESGHGNSERHRSMVLESKTYAVSSSWTPKSSWLYSLRAWPMST